MKGSIVFVLQTKIQRLTEVKKLTQKTDVCCCYSHNTGYPSWGMTRRGPRGDLWDVGNIVSPYLVPRYKMYLMKIHRAAV